MTLAPQQIILNSSTELQIDLGRIGENLEQIGARLPEKTRIMAIIKANGYGTCAATVAKFLRTRGVDIFGVAYPDEGLALREAGVEEAIFVSHAAPFEAAKIAAGRLETAVSDMETLRELEREAALEGTQIPLHLYINTGMNRCGCTPDEAPALAEAVHRSPHLELAGAMTHFASAEEKTADAFTKKQIGTFYKAVDTLLEKKIPLPYLHAANSSGALRFSLPRCNMKRIGLALYGLHLAEECRELLPLRPALSLTSRIVALHSCRRGDTISYGRSYTVTKERQKIAVIAIGYHDGLHRKYSNKGYLLVRGKKAPQVGRICMDYMMVDVTAIPDAAVGDKALIFGEGLPAEKVASWGNTIVHELISCLGPRVQRKFTSSE